MGYREQFHGGIEQSAQHNKMVESVVGAAIVVVSVIVILYYLFP